MRGIAARIRRTHLAAFLIGGVMGVMAEMAAGLILYEGSGLLRATTAVLTTAAAAAGTGLLVATRVPGEEVSRQLRRHLHLTLVSLGLAGILASLWGYYGGLSVVPGGQAAALAFLAALPLYMGGSVLGLVCRAGGRNADGGTVVGGGPALLGAATGFLIYGLFLIPRVAPPVLVLLCMAAVSGAALLHGSDAAREEADRGEEEEAGETADPDEEQDSRETVDADEEPKTRETADADEKPEKSGAARTPDDPASSITQTVWNSES